MHTITHPSLKICIRCSCLWFPICSVSEEAVPIFAHRWVQPAMSTASTEASIWWKIRHVLTWLFCVFYFIFFFTRTVDLANLMLIPLINPLTNPFPHAKESCRPAQGRATLAQLGGKEDNGTCRGPRRKNNRHGSLWELFTSVHFIKIGGKSSHAPAVLFSSKQHTVSLQREHCYTSMFTHMTHGEDSIWCDGNLAAIEKVCAGQRHITLINEHRQFVFCTTNQSSIFSNVMICC